jgi:CRP-like cAMP-binding protein
VSVLLGPLGAFDGALALAPSCEVGRGPGGAPALLGPGGATLDLADGDAAVLALVDGTRGAHEVLRAAASLDPPRSPIGVLRLLRRVARKGLLVGVAPPPPSIAAPRFSGAPSPRASLAPASRRAPSALRLPAWIVAPPVRLPAATFDATLGLAVAGLGAAIAIALARGHGGALVDPFAGGVAVGGALLATLAGASIALSARGLARGLALRSLGLPVPSARLGLRALVPCLDVDDAARSAATARDRARLARAGLAGVATVAAATALARAIDPAGSIAPLAAGAALALLAELAPYRRTDARHLAGLGARIPRQGARAAAFLTRRALSNLAREGRPSALERAYLGVATAWLSHGLVALAVVEAVVAPSCLGAVGRALGAWAASPSLASTAALAGAVVAALVAIGVLAALVGGLGAIAIGLVRQAIGRARPARPVAEGPAGPTDAARVATVLRRIPAFAALDDDAARAIAGAARVERHRPGAALRVAGRPDDALTLVLSGTTSARVVEESGLEHAVEPPSPGEAWGEGALVGPSVAATTVVSTSDVELARLDRAALDAALAERADAEAVRASLAALAAVRAHVAFAAVPSSRVARLVAAAEEARFDTGDEIVADGALHVLRSGSCRVERAGGPPLDLREGDVVGEAALLGGAGAGARVVVLEPTRALRLDARAVARALLEDPRATAALEALAAERQAFAGAR